ncbi:MAG: glycosyltransferase family 2 protein [Candidatus Altiarchaeota archaeon]|nr:glycosyltransferase family 2 protein [Candidatus Altiarchaeota archaeon]
MNPIHITLVYLLWIIITFFFMVIFLTLLKNRKSIYEEPKPSNEQPTVSVVVPAYNEEGTIREAIESLTAVDYPKDLYEIIVVNDGSTDRTAEIVSEYEKKHNIVFINNKENSGKARALNMGIGKAKGELVACLDADTTIKPDTIRKAIKHFNGDRIGAVIIRVSVKEPKNWLEKIIAVEYNMGLGFYLKIYSFLNCLYLTPGQCSVYRRNMLLEIGGFDEKSIVEDMEIAYRIQKAHYKIKCCLSAEAHTKVPDNVRSLYHQRKRWYSGSIMTIIQHRDVFFDRDLGNFGLFYVPVNYAGIIIGLLLFLSTIHLMASLILQNITCLSLVDYDIYGVVQGSIENLRIDPLSINIFYILCSTPFIMNSLMNYAGFKVLGKRVRENLFGFVCFLFFFLPYHIFWLMCFYFVIFKKEVKWRESM